MFQTASGVTIPFPEKIKEEYQVYESKIQFHLSFEKLGATLEDFIARQEEPLFFVLQIPLTRDEELALCPDGVFPEQGWTAHERVCYLDGQSKEQIRAILRQYGELLLNDGMSQFAVASHATWDEMFIMKYKLVDLYCKQPQKYFDLMESYGAPRTDRLLTAWDTFSNETPGRTRRVEMDSMDCYDVYAALVKEGMYEAKIIEE